MRSMRFAMAAATVSLMGLGLAAHDLEQRRHSVLMGMLPKGKRPKWGPGHNRGTGAGVDRAIEREAEKASWVRATYSALRTGRPV